MIRNKREKREEGIYKIIADLSGDIYFQIDKDFKVLFVNKKGLELLRKELKDIIGKKVTELFPKQGKRFVENLKKALKSKNPLLFEDEIVIGNITFLIETRLLSFEDPQTKENSVFGICRDITEFKRAEKTIEDSSKRYKLLFERNLAGVFRASLNGILLECNEAFAHILGYSSAEEIIGTSVLKFYKEESDRRALITMLSQQGFLKNYELCLKKKDGNIIWVLENVSLVEEDGNKILEGALIDITERKKIEKNLSESVIKLQKAAEGIIEAMTIAIEIRDPHTAGHERRVGKLAKAIAEEMGLEEEKVQAIYLTGLIHDIGKIYVPAEILTKPGTLSEIEYKLIKVHPEMGYKILEKVEFSWPLSKIIIQHHERLDGSGYPKGLKNDEICLEARILAVADVIESMASHRPYRSPLGLEVALKEIENNAGKLYDKNVVEATIRIFKKGFILD